MLLLLLLMVLVYRHYMLYCAEPHVKVEGPFCSRIWLGCGCT